MLLHMKRNMKIPYTVILEEMTDDLRRRLPPQWLLCERERDALAQTGGGSAQEIDAIFEIKDPQGSSAEIIVESKSNPPEPRLISYITAQLRGMSFARYEEIGAVGALPIPLLVSSFISPLARERLTEAGISYADSTGKHQVHLRPSSGLY